MHQLDLPGPSACLPHGPLRVTKRKRLPYHNVEQPDGGDTLTMPIPGKTFDYECRFGTEEHPCHVILERGLYLRNHLCL